VSFADEKLHKLSLLLKLFYIDTYIKKAVPKRRKNETEGTSLVDQILKAD
jgi:hypothetical protein